MKDDIYKSLNKPQEIVKKVEIDTSKQMNEVLEKKEKVKNAMEQLTDLTEKMEEISQIAAEPPKIEVIIPEKVKISNLDEIPETVLEVPDTVKINNAEEIGKEVAKAIPPYIAPEITIPSEITVKNMPVWPDFPTTFKVDNLTDLLQTGDKPGKADPTRYLPVRLTNGKNFINELANGYVAASKAVFPYVNMTTGKPQPAAVDDAGIIQTNAGSSTGTTTISGLVTGVYGAPPTVISGSTWPLQLDQNANLKDTLATLIAGEDLTNNVLKVEQRFSYSNINTNATTTVKSGAGFLHAISINQPGAANSLTIYDNTAGSGTKIGTYTTISGVWDLIFDVSFGTGLTIVTAGGTAGDYTVAYR